MPNLCAILSARSMLFAGSKSSSGPEPTSSDVRYLAAIKGKADMPLTCRKNQV